MPQDPVLITGAAGFIGLALARHLLRGSRSMVGVDNINEYYDPALKKARSAVLSDFAGFTFGRLDRS
jgi:UDP-glucuronate 4-epimerase